MKTSHGYLVGTIIGVGVAFILPVSDEIALLVANVAKLIIDIGHYLLLPIIFFSLPVAITQMRRVRKLHQLAFRSVLYVVITSALFVIVGTLLALGIEFGRIPVILGEKSSIEIAGFTTIIEHVIRFDGFWNSSQEGIGLLILILPSCLLGWHFFHDREIAEPAYNFFDSLSRILYQANRYLLKLMPLFLAILALHVVYQMRFIVEFQRFIPLLQLLFGICFALIFVIYPLALWQMTKMPTWRVLGNLSAVFIGSFISASPMFNYGSMIFHLKEKLHLPRRTTACLAPVYLMFSRGGTALVASICMMTVIRSYSSLDITLYQAAWTALFSFLISFALPTLPDRGLIAALILLGKIYGRGLEDGWLILVPIIPLLIMICTLLDTLIGTFLLILASLRSGLMPDTD